jgi:hypothetical protein
MMQKLTLTNFETTTLTITGFTFMETYATSFSQTNARGTSVAARASCSITITFKPTQSGSLKGRRLRIMLPVCLDTGLERNSYRCNPVMSLSPASLVFASTGIGVATVVQLLYSTYPEGSTNSISERLAIDSTENAH